MTTTIEVETAWPIDVDGAAESKTENLVLAATLSAAATLHPVFPLPSAVMAGRLLNFGLVMPGVYRGSYPTSTNFDFIRGLGLKTIVYVLALLCRVSVASYVKVVADTPLAHWSRGTRRMSRTPPSWPPTASGIMSST